MREAVEQAFATKPFVVRLRAEQKIPEGPENGGCGMAASPGRTSCNSLSRLKTFLIGINAEVPIHHVAA
jgi:hypothetical protein